MYVSEHLLPRVHGFELLMAPYTVAHMKLGLQLQEMGYEFDSDERLRIFLTNSLEDAFEKDSMPALPFAEWLVNEGRAASGVKQDSPVMVIVGNPPYSYDSLNKGEWISQLIRDYYQVDGKPLKERNPKGLQDDYIKFIRFAQWRIEQTGYGILGFITNHGYLDNPTFRGMRQHLLTSFDEIYVLDLHGNAKKKEKALDGGVDKNVFDIQQGVAISLLVKHRLRYNKPAKVFHADLWGVRDGKYHWLEEQDVAKTQWTKLKPQSPFYLFIPQNTELLEEYEKGWKITEAMLVSSTGIKTHRDHFVIDFEEEKLKQRINDFVNLNFTDTEIAETYKLKDTRDWKLSQRRKSLASNSQWQQYFTRCLYRPFDYRAYYHHKDVIELPRKEVMQHMLAGENLALSTTRSIEIGRGWEHIFCSNSLIQHHTVSLKEVNYLFHLYLYPTEKDEFLNGNGKPKPKRKPNFALNFIKGIEARLKLQFIDDGTGDLKTTIGPEDIFHYMYAVFHSPTYRQRYAEFLKIDFPRLPLTRDKNLFQQLANLGTRLVTIHLMEANIDTDSGYPIEGDNVVAKITYKNDKVYINKTQYFDNVTDAVWRFHIGGYQVCHKWLKDRKGRKLSYDDCNHYLYILAALEQTIELMTKIDETIPEFPWS